MAEFGTLKVGDVCKVVGNCNKHEFKIGEVVKLYSVWDDLLVEKGMGFFAERLDSSRCTGDIASVREIDLEKVENMDKMKEFTKSDLKEFDEVVFRNGNKNVFYQNGFRGDCSKYIKCYEENLLRNDNREEFDIMQVIRNKEVIWERIEKSPLQIELESLEQQQREIADKIAELSKKCN